MSIYVSVCGDGFGHARRQAQVIRELEKLDEIVVGCYDYEGYFRKLGFQTHLTSPELTFKGKGGKIDFKLSLVQTLKNLPGYKKESEALDLYKPEIVISDNRWTVLWLAWKRGIPTILVSNQTQANPMLALNSGERALYGAFNTFFNVFLRFPTVVVIPDFPPPHAISKLNLMEKFCSKYVYLGPIIDENIRNAIPSDEGYVLTVVTGGKRLAFRAPILHYVKKTAEQMPWLEFKVISHFHSKRLRYKNLEVLPPQEDSAYVDYFRCAKMIISPASLTLAHERIYLAKKGILIPDPYSEEWGNALRCYELELFEVVPYRHLKSLPKVIEKVGQRRYERLEQLSKLAREMRGEKNLAELVKRLLEN